jgi:dethiobiotin synthetase
VANRLDPEMAAYSENLMTLNRRLACPLLAELPYANQPDARAMSALIAPKRLAELVQAAT